MAVLTLGTTPEAKHNLPNQLEGTDFPSNLAIFNRAGHGRMFGWGDTLPANGTTGWGKGAIFLDTNGAAADLLVFVNNGTTSSSTFVEVTSPAGTDFGSTGMLTDVVLESTSTAGVTVDGAVLKDGGIKLSGVTTPAGGVAPAGGTTIVLARPGAVCHTGGQSAQSTADGFDAQPVITEIYYSELFVPCSMSVTGISFFNGSNVTDSTHSALLDADGALVTGSATGAIQMSGTDTYQRIPFSGGAITVLGPATYYVAQIFDGTASRYNAHGIGGVVTTGVELSLNAAMVAGKITSQSYAAIPATNSLTLTWVTDLGPIASLY